MEEYVAKTPFVASVELALNDTQYMYVIPPKVKYFTLRARTAAAFRLSFVGGTVALGTNPFVTIGSGVVYTSPRAMKTEAPIQLFLATSAAPLVVEIEYWW